MKKLISNSNFSGKVYLTEIDGKKYIIKEIPLLKKFIKNKPDYEMSLWREIHILYPYNINLKILF